VLIVPVYDVWRDPEAAMLRIGARSSGTLQVGAKTYDVAFQPGIEDEAERV